MHAPMGVNALALVPSRTDQGGVRPACQAGPTRIAEIAELAAALEVDLVELLRLEGPQEPPAVRQLELPFGEDSSVAYLEIECVKSALIIRPARIQRGTESPRNETPQ